MPDIPGWDDKIHGAIRDLVELVGQRLALCTTSTRYPLVRQCAAAYLARMRRLIIGMDLLYEAEMPDLVGGELRMCLEAWVTGMWVLAVGADALVILDADNITRSRRFLERADLDLDLETLDRVEGAPRLPGIRDRFQEVEDHLVAEGDATAGEIVRWAYHVVYSAESGEGIHAGLISVLGHLILDPDRWEIRTDRYESGDGAGKILWAATLLAMLARRVFREFGIETDYLDEVASPIQRLAVDLNENPLGADPTQAVGTTSPPGAEPQ